MTNTICALLYHSPKLHRLHLFERRHGCPRPEVSSLPPANRKLTNRGGRKGGKEIGGSRWVVGVVVVVVVVVEAVVVVAVVEVVRSRWVVGGGSAG